MAILKSARSAESEILKIAGIGVIGTVGIYALIKSAPALGNLVNNFIGAITSGISAGIPSFAGGGGTGGGSSPPPPPNTYQTPNTFGPGTDNQIPQNYIPSYQKLQGHENTEIVTPALPADPYVSKGPYSLETYLAIANAQGEPPSTLIKGTSGGFLSVVAEGTGQQISDVLLTRGKALNSFLAHQPDVISGIVSTESGGTRQITGSKGLFERLAQNLGVPQ